MLMIKSKVSVLVIDLLMVNPPVAKLLVISPLELKEALAKLALINPLINLIRNQVVKIQLVNINNGGFNVS